MYILYKQNIIMMFYMIYLLVKCLTIFNNKKVMDSKNAITVLISLIAHFFSNSK